MRVRKTKIEGLIEFFPRIFKDDRGFFLETYSVKTFKELGLDYTFIQDNQSFSKKGVVRGLHFQNAPFAQGKLVRVVSGKAIDIAVDIRPNSPTFGHWESFLLDAELSNLVYIPEGFAHGFSVLEDCVFSYKCTNVYDKASESGLFWNDLELKIDWQVSNPIVSEKDAILPTLATLFPNR